jgi:ribokinase
MGVRMKKVIVFGSLNMDMTIECRAMPQKGETIDGSGFFTNPGGKGGNQAVAAAKLGAETHMIARIGKDLFGDEIHNRLLGYGVNCELIDSSENQATGVAMILLCEGDNRIILSPGSNHEMRIEQVSFFLEKIACPGDVFITQFECDYDTTIQALAKARDLAMFTLFNPAPAKRIPDESYGNIDLIVVNQSECAFLTGIYPQDESDCSKAVALFQGLGAKHAIITLGSKGSVTVLDKQVHLVRSYKVDLVDTTSAGDAYIGALASLLVRGENIVDSMRFATKAAALTITKHGAQQSIPDLKELNDFFKEGVEYA